MKASSSKDNRETASQKWLEDRIHFNEPGVNDAPLLPALDRSPRIGIGREDFWRGLRAEKSGIRAIDSFDRSIFNAHCAAEIPDWKPEDSFPPHRLKRLDRYAQFAVASAKLALDDAGIP